MVEKFKEILGKLKKKGDISLFAVMKMDEFTDRWSVVIVADWALQNKDKSFEEISNVFIETLTKEESDSIARIGLFNKEDYIAKLFSQYKEGTEIKEKTQINSFTVYEGYVLASAHEEGKTK